MNEGEENPTAEFNVAAELATIAEKNILPARIVQKITEKLQEKKITLTREQLYTLIEKIQQALSMYTVAQKPLQPQKPQTQAPVQQDKTTWDAVTVKNTDMKQLAEAVDQLNKRLKALEQNHIDAVKGVTGKLVRTKDITTLEPADLLQDDIEPLERVPSDPESIVVLMKWLQYLVDKTGKTNLPEVLGYYVDIGWISDDVRLDLLNYSKGITEPQTHPAPKGTHLPTRDHLQSLLFIQKLKGIHLDERFLNKIERDMEKMVKSLEGYPDLK